GARELLGSRMPRTWAEFPAQVMEMFRSQPEVLSRYARHYETGEPMPQHMLDRLMASAETGMGIATARNLAYTLLDLLWHQSTPDAIPSGADLHTQVSDLESAVLAEYGLD